MKARKYVLGLVLGLLVSQAQAIVIYDARPKATVSETGNKPLTLSLYRGHAQRGIHEGMKAFISRIGDPIAREELTAGKIINFPTPVEEEGPTRYTVITSSFDRRGAREITRVLHFEVQDGMLVHDLRLGTILDPNAVFLVNNLFNTTLSIYEYHSLGTALDLRGGQTAENARAFLKELQSYNAFLEDGRGGDSELLRALRDMAGKDKEESSKKAAAE